MDVGKFILQLEREELHPAISQDEVDDIEKGVNEFVKLLTDEVAKEEKLFTVKRILKVGSFYEKTKVGNPDEFDFLLELDGTFEVERGCEHNPCSAHVKVVAPECTNETELHKTRAISSDGHLVAGSTYTQWRRCVERVLNKALNDKNNLGRIDCTSGHLNIVQKLWGSGPNAEIGLAWHGENEFVIGVDLSICIPCTDELIDVWQNEFIPLDMTVVPRLVLVVPSESRNMLSGISCRMGYRRSDGTIERARVCWKISTTPIEVYKMRNIPEPYRLCYLVLKWMCKKRKDQSPMLTDSLLTLSSYMLKNAVLCCQATCSNKQQQKESVDCLEEILKYLFECAYNNFLPAFFIPNVNLWRFVDGEAAPPREIISMLMEFLFKTLKESEAESFSFKDVRKKVRKLQKKFERIDRETVDILNFPKPKLALANKHKVIVSTVKPDKQPH